MITCHAGEDLRPRLRLRRVSVLKRFRENCKISSNDAGPTVINTSANHVLGSRHGEREGKNELNSIGPKASADLSLPGPLQPCLRDQVGFSGGELAVGFLVVALVVAFLGKCEASTLCGGVRAAPRGIVGRLGRPSAEQQGESEYQTKAGRNDRGRANGRFAPPVELHLLAPSDSMAPPQQRDCNKCFRRWRARKPGIYQGRDTLRPAVTKRPRGRRTQRRGISGCVLFSSATSWLC